MSRNEAIWVISDMGQANYYVQAENKLNYLVWEEHTPNMKRSGRATKYQATTMEMIADFSVTTTVPLAHDD